MRQSVKASSLLSILIYNLSVLKQCLSTHDELCIINVKNQVFKSRWNYLVNITLGVMYVIMCKSFRNVMVMTMLGGEMVYTCGFISIRTNNSQEIFKRLAQHTSSGVTLHLSNKF